MPPKQRISKQDIIDAGFRILKQNGISNVNARAVCEELNCSTQPIFSQFENMNELKQELIEKSRENYNEYVKQALSGATLPFKASSIAYINFAKNKPHLFSLLFMNEKVANSTEKKPEITEDAHFHLWVYAHGIATLVATNSLQFTDEQINQMITYAYDTIVLK